jgi:hypothetical protein
MNRRQVPGLRLPKGFGPQAGARCQVIGNREQVTGNRKTRRAVKTGSCPLSPRRQRVSRCRRFHQPEPRTVRCRAERDGPSPADPSPEGGFGPQGEGLWTLRARRLLRPTGG